MAIRAIRAESPDLPISQSPNYIEILVFVSALLIPSIADAQTLVLDDPLSGSTSGTRGGGAFVAGGGWKVTGKDDHIYWHVPTLSSGAVEFHVRGLRPDEAGAGMADKTELFHMYDWTYGSADTVYDGYRNNPFKHFVRKTNVMNGPKNNSMELVWVIGSNYMEPDTSVLSWDENATYVFREEWGPDGTGKTQIKTYRDGVLVMTMAEPGAYAPMGHSIRIAASTRTFDPNFGAPINAVFSNVKVWNMSGVFTPGPSPAPSAGPVLGISGDQFTLNGTPRFLVGTSYFDGRFWRASDLDFLASKGFNLIRIWLDWADRGFFDSSGNLVFGSTLLELVRAAGARGMVVDVTVIDPLFVPGFGNRIKAIEETLDLLDNEPNVLFDVMNEHDHSDGPASHMQVTAMVAAAKSKKPGCIVTVSGTGGHLDSSSDLDAELAAGINVLAPHDPRTGDWYSQTGERVAAYKAALAARGKTMPVYFQEPARRGWSGQFPPATHFLTALSEAKDAGAAAWIFHTAAGYNLGAASYFDALDSEERAVCDGVAMYSPGPVPPGGGGGGGGSSNGLRGDYFNNMDFTAPGLTRTDATIDFDWAEGAPAPGVGAEQFSVRWTGQIEPQYSELYTFYTWSDDGIRLWVNGALIIDNWTDHAPMENAGSIYLTAGVKVDIKIEFYENGVYATAKLSWESASQPKQIVPSGRLTPTTGAAPAPPMPPSPPAPPAPPVPASGTGLLGEYHDGTGLAAPVLFSRVDATVDFDWGGGSPDPSMNGNTWSVRWTGELDVPETGTWMFLTTSDDGVRLWVDGALIVNNWTVHGATLNIGTRALTAGTRVDITIEYFEKNGDAVMRLEWIGPSQERQVIPMSRLYPPGSAPAPAPAPMPPAPAPVPGGTGTGLRAHYFDAIDFTMLEETQIDPTIDFDWGGGAPPGGLGPDEFSVRWSGQVEPTSTGLWTFYTTSDDGVRVWVNGVLVVDSWWDHGPEEYSGALSLDGGVKVDIVVEYYENTGGAMMRLEWSGPGQSRQVVPAARLYPAP